MKPILFNTEMVQAIMDGRKTTTRRVIKPKYSNTDFEMFTNKYGTRLVERQNDAPADYSHTAADGSKHTVCHLTAIEEVKPKFRRGDVLYVRETWQYGGPVDGNDQVIGYENRYYYAADNETPFTEWVMPDGTHRDHMIWRPSIFMPKEAARLFLCVTAVRAERLRDMSRDDAISEGVNAALKDIAPDLGYYRVWNAMQSIWDGTMNAADREKYGWDANPWVWVIEFKRIDRTEALGRE